MNTLQEALRDLNKENKDLPLYEPKTSDWGDDESKGPVKHKPFPKIELSRDESLTEADEVNESIKQQNEIYDELKRRNIPYNNNYFNGEDEEIEEIVVDGTCILGLGKTKVYFGEECIDLDYYGLSRAGGKKILDAALEEAGLDQYLEESLNEADEKKSTVCNLLHKYRDEWETAYPWKAMQKAVLDCLDKHQAELEVENYKECRGKIAGCKNEGGFYSTIGTYLTCERVGEELTEALGDPADLPIILSEEEILNYVESLPKAGPGIPPKKFKLGYISNLTNKVAAQFRGGRGSVDKETGEVMPMIEVLKISEYTGCYVEPYSSAEKTKQAFKNVGKDIDTDVLPRRGFHPAPNGIRGIFESDAGKGLAVGPLMDSNAKTYVRYFLRINGGELVESSKEQVAQYMPAAWSKPQEYSSEAQRTQTFYLSGIYLIGDLGQSKF